MQVLLHRELDHLAIGAARHDHRQLELQGQQLLQHAGHALHGGKRGGQLGAVTHAGLALAVIAHAGGLENAGQERRIDSGQIGLAADHGIGCAFDAAGLEMRLLVGTVLALGHGTAGRRHRARGGELGQRLCRHILEFGGDRVAGLGQLGQALRVEVVGTDLLMGDCARRAFGIGVQHHRAVAQALRRLHEHAAELAATHHTQRGNARQQDLGHQTRSLLMPLACSV